MNSFLKDDFAVFDNPAVFNLSEDGMPSLDEDKTKVQTKKLMSVLNTMEKAELAN